LLLTIQFSKISQFQSTAIFGFFKALQKLKWQVLILTQSPLIVKPFFHSPEEPAADPDEKAAAFSLSLYQRRRRVIIPDWRKKSTLFFNYFLLNNINMF
jgi:hypothetical protein